jgi:hypothetical protein
MINLVQLWSNGMVMVFDNSGQQMPDYQGRFLDRREAILRDAPPKAMFAIGTWGEGTVPMTREQFASVAWEPRPAADRSEP